MLLKENSDIHHCSKLLILLKNAHVSKLVALSVENIAWLSRKYNKKCGFHGSLSQKGSRPLEGQNLLSGFYHYLKIHTVDKFKICIFSNA